jgi:acetolactate synthase-1/2/3 large subunit
MAYIHSGRIVAKALAAEGVSHLFTLCGGHIQAIYDGCLDENIRVVDFRHEQSAAHAADGWARATGKPGVAAVTAGPGVTDAVTAVANAYRAGVPMVLIGGAGPRVLQDKGSLQDMDHCALMSSITKWAKAVPDVSRLAEYVAMAFRHATTGVPGPVFLEIPLDFLMDMKPEDKVKLKTGYRTENRLSPDPAAIDEAVAILKAAQRPVCVMGSQLRWARDPQGALNGFLDATETPVFVNGMARGSITPGTSRFYNRSRSWALRRCDAVLVFGTPLDFRLRYGDSINKEAQIIQIDFDGSIIGENRHVHVGIPADTGATLEALTRAITDAGGLPDSTGWHAEIREQEEKKWDVMRAEMALGNDPPNPMRLCAEVAKFMKKDTIVVGDGGDFVATAAYTLPIHGIGRWMDPGPLGTLGVGPGYAMAAKLANPDSDVIIMFGDGSFGLNGMEFEAMVRQDIKVIGIIGNDAGWTQILRGQRQIYGEDRVVATKLAYTRYDQVVEGLGGHGEYVEKVEDLPAALERAFTSPKAALVNVKIGASDFRKNAISV